MNIRSLLTNLLLLLFSLAALLLVLEMALRILDYPAVAQLDEGSSAAGQVPKHIVTDTPVLYALNPEHHQVSSQGLRDDEVAVPAPGGQFRMLVLGDSIAYGSSVKRDRTFPNRLETLLAEKHAPVEVINSGVSGYTAYNELQYYLHEGYKFDADIVMVAFCMNDVVNPRLHWGYTDDVIKDIPGAAIPNPEYDRDHVLPMLRKLRERQEEPSAGGVSRLYALLEPRIRQLMRNDSAESPPGQGVPEYLTGDDDISIKVLLDEQSPEWIWLRGIYDQLHAAVTANGAQLMIGIFPLAYQLDEGYPYFPQTLFADYCRQREIACLDFLPAFRKYPPRKLFRLDRDPVYDVWHLTGFGHDYTAQLLMKFLEQQGMLQ